MVFARKTPSAFHCCCANTLLGDRLGQTKKHTLKLLRTHTLKYIKLTFNQDSSVGAIKKETVRVKRSSNEINRTVHQSLSEQILRL
jgi:hypothetical protein